MGTLSASLRLNFADVEVSKCQLNRKVASALQSGLESDVHSSARPKWQGLNLLLKGDNPQHPFRFSPEACADLVQLHTRKRCPSYFAPELRLSQMFAANRKFGSKDEDVTLRVQDLSALFCMQIANYDMSVSMPCCFPTTLCPNLRGDSPARWTILAGPACRFSKELVGTLNPNQGLRA